MRLPLALTLALLLAGCQEVEPDSAPIPPEPVAPGATATPESPTTPDRPAPEAADEVVVLFFGDSLTAGYGLGDPDDAYPRTSNLA